MTQQLKLITANAQAAASTEASDIQWFLEENLKQQYAFAEKRFKTAFLYASLATTGVMIALVIFTALNAFNLRHIPDQFRLYVDFYEWRTTSPSEICTWTCELGKQATRLTNNLGDIGASMFSADGEGNPIGSIAGIARLCTLIAVFFSVVFSYRQLLLERYELHGHMAQYDDYKSMPTGQRLLTRILYTLASLFGTYVVISILWLGLAQMFKTLTLDWLNAAIIIILFTGVTTLVATYIAVAVTTREITLLAMSIFVTGFAASFALSQPIAKGTGFKEWWELAVSSAGQDNPSAPLFTGTLLSGPLALLVLWFDLDGILLKMIRDGRMRYFSENQWLWVGRVLYAMLVIGLILVGLIRVDSEKFRENMIFHAGGASIAIISAIVSGFLIRKHRFHPWYKFFSVYILLGALVIMGILGVVSLKSESSPQVSIVAVGDGLVSLTVIELVLFLLIGIWMYLTVDNLLGQANINAFDGPVLVIARKDQPD